MGFDIRQDWPLAVGVVAMVGLVAGTFVEEGTFVQRLIFLLGAPVLGVAAYVNDQEMLVVLQGVITLSAVLAFFPSVLLYGKLGLLLGSSLAGVVYLWRRNYGEEDRFWYVGAVGLIVLAFGLSMSGVSSFLFNLLLAVGGLVVALYAVLGYVVLNVRIQALWIVLNLVFMINPMLRVLSMV